jgi:3-isopropylmalate dehydrogenase
MEAVIALLPGDGIGAEIVRAAHWVLNAVADRFEHSFLMEEYPAGGCAIDAFNDPLPAPTLAACLDADAVLLGAVGGPKWDDPTASLRPEQGLLKLRYELGLFANLRPVRPHPALLQASPLRPDRLAGVDVLIVRELTGGIYFGQPRLRRTNAAGEAEALDTMLYTESEIRRVARIAFDLARVRRAKVSSIDKANVLESSRLWRQTVAAVAADYPDVALEHVLVDAAAMFLITRPSSFDVLLTSNMFGDILSDEASVLTGSVGNLPSASLGEQANRVGLPRGLYEPIHGSAPDIAGKGIANPIGTILSAAMLLRHSLGLEKEADMVEGEVSDVLENGYRTADLASVGQAALDTKQITDLIIQRVLGRLSAMAGQKDLSIEEKI